MPYLRPVRPYVFCCSFGTHLPHHLASDGAGLLGGEGAVVALVQGDAYLPWCSCSILKWTYFRTFTGHIRKICSGVYRLGHISHRLSFKLSDKLEINANALQIFLIPANWRLCSVWQELGSYLNLFNEGLDGFFVQSFNVSIREVLYTTGITATAGIGTNLFLAKVAMDIVAKHVPADKDGVRVAELNEQSYRELLWCHTPITDFWRVGHGIARRLEKLGCYTMGDVAMMSVLNEDLLYQAMGINAELLIDHAWGYEPVTMDYIKAYRPSTTSLSSGQVLMRPYEYDEGRLIVMVREEARLTDSERELPESELELLNKKMSLIMDVIEEKQYPEITVRYFVPDRSKAGGRYEEMTGTVKRIDPVERSIIFFAPNMISDGRSVSLDKIAEIHGTATREKAA